MFWRETEGAREMQKTTQWRQRLNYFQLTFTLQNLQTLFISFRSKKKGLICLFLIIFVTSLDTHNTIINNVFV